MSASCLVSELTVSELVCQRDVCKAKKGTGMHRSGGCAPSRVQGQSPLEAETIFNAVVKLGFFYLYSLGWHTLPSHANAEACLTGWPNA